MSGARQGGGGRRRAAPLGLGFRGLGGALLLGLMVIALPLAAGAQRRRSRNEPVTVTITWSLFIAGLPDQEPARRPIDGEAGELPLAGSSWSCAYEASSRVQLNAEAWSEQRGIVCRHGEARVRSQASCRVYRSEVFETPATLELGQGEEHQSVTVTLGCLGHTTTGQTEPASP